MENLIIILVLFAAFLHAFWNFLVRGSDDKVLTMAAVVLGHIPAGLVGIIIFGLPNVESIFFILFSSILHFCYQIFLLNAYRYGELTQVYPIARGLSPLIIVLISTLLIDEGFTKLEFVGIIFISFSILAYGIKIKLNSKENFKGFYFSIIAGLFIASYSLVDGYGGRLSKNPIGFYSTLTIINSLLFSIYLTIFHKGMIKKLIAEGKTIFLIGGTASYGAYAIVVWACFFLPIAIVSSLRETSILFALLLSFLFLKERLTIFKFSIITTLLIGIVLIKYSI